MNSLLDIESFLEFKKGYQYLRMIFRIMVIWKTQQKKKKKR